MKPLSVKGFEHYLVDEFGNVYSSLNKKGAKLDIPKIKKQFPNKNTGYMQVQLVGNNVKSKLFYVHRLVAITYIPNPDNLVEVNHINGIKNDNRVSNLEWNTRSQNVRHVDSLFGRNTISKLILNDRVKLEEGINHYKKYKDWNKLCDIWNCSRSTSYKIIKKIIAQE
jgi:hypothetical protein